MLSLLTESWTWYAFACVLLIARYTSRWLQFGSFRLFQTEDYVMLVVFAFYTCLIIFMNEVAHLDTNLILAADIPGLTAASIESRIYGSKLVLVVEQSMIMTIWGCKVSLLLMYNQMTMGLKQQLAVKIVAGYVVVNFVVMEILYFGVWCRPFYEYWAVPTDNEQCSAALHHLITNAVFNITSDIMMLCIPLPLLIISQLPQAKKLILCSLFGLGVFVILCACLNKYYSFAHPFSPMWTFWYIREASTAIYVANMPMCWALMRRIFHLRSFNGSSGSRSRSKSIPIGATYGKHSTKLNTTISTHGIKLPSQTPSERRGDQSWWDKDAHARGLSRSESEEYIIPGGQVKGGKDVALEIWESRQVEVHTTGTSSAVGSQATLTTQSGDRGLRTQMYDGNTKEFQTKTVISSSPLGSDGGRRSSGSSGGDIGKGRGMK